MPTPFPFNSRLAPLAPLLPLPRAEDAHRRPRCDEALRNQSQPVGQGRVQGRVHGRRAAGIQSRHGALSFVRLDDGGEGVRRPSPRPIRPAAWRTGAAPWCMLDNPFVWPGNLPAAKLNEIAAALDCRPRGRAEERAREGLRRGDGRLRARSRQARPPHPPQGLRRRRWRSLPAAIPTTRRRRSCPR